MSSFGSLLNLFDVGDVHLGNSGDMINHLPNDVSKIFSDIMDDARSLVSFNVSADADKDGNAIEFSAAELGELSPPSTPSMGVRNVGLEV